MKRKHIIAILLSIALLLTGCQKTSDAIRFKKEYEKLNGQKDENGVSYSDIEIDENNTIRYMEYDQLQEVFNNGTHLVYLGWPGCPWCRRSLPVVIDTVNSYPGIYIYYFNILQYRNEYEKNPDSDKGKKYKAVADMLKQYSTQFYDDGTAKLVASNFYFIKDGEIIGVHNRTVSTHYDPYEPLMDYQKEELSTIIAEYLEILIKTVPPGCKEC